MAKKTIHALTESDRQAIAGMLDKQRRTAVNKSKPYQLPADPPLPELFLAMTPPDGIPGAAGRYPGYADDCQIYRQVGDTTPYFDYVPGLVRRVYNAFPADMPGGQWCLVARDKFGTWFALGGGSFVDLEVTGTGTGTTFDTHQSIPGVDFGALIEEADPDFLLAIKDGYLVTASASANDFIQVTVTTGVLPSFTVSVNTMTATANGAMPPLDVTDSPSIGYLVLYRPGTADDGIWEVTDAGSAGTPWVMERTAFLAGDQVESLQKFGVRSGTRYGGSLWLTSLGSATALVGSDSWGLRFIGPLNRPLETTLTDSSPAVVQIGVNEVQGPWRFGSDASVAGSTDALRWRYRDNTSGSSHFALPAVNGNWTICATLAGTDALPANHPLASFTTDAPASGCMIVGFLPTGEIRIFDVADWPTAAAGAPADAVYIVGTASGGLSAELVATDTETINYVGAGATAKWHVIKQMSITADASGIKLEGDAASPGNDKFYGTDGAGTKGFYSVPSSLGALRYVGSVIASAASEVDFVLSTDPGYAIWWESSSPGTNGANLLLLTSTDGGSNFDVGVSDYIWVGHEWASGPVDGPSQGNPDAAIHINDNASSAANEEGDGLIILRNPSATAHCKVRAETSWWDSGGLLRGNNVVARRLSTTPVNAVRLKYHTGTITGTFHLFKLVLG